MKFCKRLLLAATAASLTLLLSVVGNAQAQQSCQSRRIHLHLSDPQLQDELVCELIDDFTSRYSESLADKTNYCQPARHQQGRHHRRPDACRRGGQPAARPNCTQAECQSTECAVAHSCTAPQEYEAGWVAFSDAEDASTGQVKVLCRRCQAPGCNFLEKEWEVNLTK